MTRKTLRNVLFGGVAAVALASAAWAQTTPSPSTPPTDRRAQHFQRVCADAPARLAARLAYAEVRLGITDAQRTAWNTYVQEIRASGEPMRKLCADPPKAAAKDDATGMLQNRERFMTAMLETTRAARAATEKLQPVLNAEQKETLAKMTRRAMGGGKRHGMHHHGGHHGMHRDHGGGPASGPPAGSQAPR
jgi:protein CpxP